MLRLIVVIFISSLFCSCVNTRRVTYFNDLPDSTSFTAVSAPEVVLRSNDLLSIHVTSPNSDATKIFNEANNPQVRATTVANDVMEPGGYLVDHEGYVNFMLVGRVKAEGLTRRQFEEKLAALIRERKLLMDPEVDVRILNFRVTVLGEVTKPAVIAVPDERITLLQAIGLAGDLTIYGKRNNVLVIREEEGVRKTTRIDLNSKNFLSSPYYYLKSNDVVYVQPNKAKIFSGTRASQLIPSILSGLSIAIFVLDRIKFN